MTENVASRKYVSSCEDCPMSVWQQDDGARDICFHDDAPPDPFISPNEEWPDDGADFTDSPPAWCPLRRGATLVVLRLEKDAP